MQTKMKKLIVSGLFGAILLFTAAGSASADDQNIEAMLAQIQWLKQQILLVRIQLVEQQIYRLQQQFEQLTANSASAYVDVISPNGGEYIVNRGNYYIRWESRGVEKVRIELETPENGTIIADNIPAADGRYYWYTGNITGSNYRIKITDVSRPGVAAMSSGKFTIFDSASGERCVDGTVAGKCSATKPELCIDNEVGLSDACHSCGCPSGRTCGSDSSCH
jgi:hypothetical protein